MKRLGKNQQAGAILLAAGGIVCFSTKAIFIKKAYEYQIDTISLLLLRMLFSLPFYTVFAILAGRRSNNKALRKGKNLVYMIFLGIAGYYLSSYLDFSGLHYVTASLERLILFSYPTLVVLITAFIYRNRIPVRQVLAILITYFGIFLSFFQNVNLSGQVNGFKGAILIAGCAVTYAIYLVGSDKMIPVFGSVKFTSYAMIIATCVIALHYSLQETKPLFAYPAPVYRIGIGMAILSTVLPSFMISEAIRKIGAPGVAIIGSIGPFATIILSAIFLGERITVFEGLGTMIVISGVLIVNLEPHNKDRNEEEQKRIAA
jgi:drug/metabolite transporter (DMT)-like permease